MTLSDDLKKATDHLMRAVAETGEAAIAADHARVSGTMTFEIAAAYRNAEKNMYAKADKMLEAYVDARRAGEITLMPSPEVNQD